MPRQQEEQYSQGLWLAARLAVIRFLFRPAILVRYARTEDIPWINDGVELDLYVVAILRYPDGHQRTVIEPL